MRSPESYSKIIMASFFGSYLYLAFTIGGSPNGGWLGATFFIIVGLFASSIIVGMPVYIISDKAPKIKVLVLIAGVVITFFLTKLFFHLLLV